MKLSGTGSSGVELSLFLTEALDADLAELASTVRSGSFAAVAVGGYGRREQCRHSDIDLMLLFDREPEREVVDAVLYPLWDTGIPIGYSVRTPEQAAAAAKENVETLTSLLSARLIAGDAQLYERFLRARRKIVRRNRRWMRSELAGRRRELVREEPWQLQQPDVKRSRGGLRELHAVQWLAEADAIADERDPTQPGGALADARETLLLTRHALHSLTERPEDRYLQSLVAAVAERIGVEPEAWSRRLFTAMRHVDANAEQALQPPASRLPRWLRRGSPPPATPPEHSAGSDLDRLLTRLRTASPATLEPLPDEQWLARVLPEWEVLRALPHIAPFHRHPADVHVWRTVVEALRGASQDEDNTETVAVTAGLSNADELLLGAFLHDIGKGHGGNHSEVGAVITERFATRAGLDDETARRLITVVQHHLLLATVATRRDIADERVIRETAALAGDVATLDLLYLVSIADARATGPDVWNAWKAQLVHSLFIRVREELSGVSPDGMSTTERLRGEAAAALGPRLGTEAVLAHLDQLPSSYVLSTPPETIGEHLELIREAAGGSALRHDELHGIDRLTLVTTDRPGILSAVAGTLAVHNVQVLGGVAYTRDDGVAIEVLHVSDALGRSIDDRRWARVMEDVPQALAGGFPIDERLAETRATYATSATYQGEAAAGVPTTVTVDNQGSEEYSIVDVRAADRLGLLYAITTALHELSLDIHLAKVDTIGREVTDAFYVRRQNGRRVEEADEIERLVSRVTSAIAALDEAPA